MCTISLAGNAYSHYPDETVLETLLRNDVAIPHSCKQGVCLSCLLRCTDVKPADEAQVGLKDTMKQQKYFLACLYRPKQDISISFPQTSRFRSVAQVISKVWLNRSIIRVELKCKQNFAFHAGQFVLLKRPDGLSRSYSIANLPNDNGILEFHIRCLAGGRFSEWAHNELVPGDTIPVSEPMGHCYYTQNDRNQSLLLVATGSGLAPMSGILSEALRQGHVGSIRLFHGSRTIQGLYWIDKMRRLESEYSNFSYRPCVSNNNAPDGYNKGRACQVALNAIANFNSWRVYLCGHPEMVHYMRRQTFMRGASFSDIYADAFIMANSSS